MDADVAQARTGCSRVDGAAAPATSGSRTVKQVWPGTLSTCDRAAVRLRPRPRRSPARARCCRPRATARCRRGRTARRSCGSSAGGMPGPSSSDGDHGGRRPRRRAPTVTVVPAGVCVRALASRLATTWCSRAASPVTDDRLVGQLELPGVVRPGGVRVADRVDHQHASGRPCSRSSGRPASSRASSSRSSTSAASSGSPPTRPGPARGPRPAERRHGCGGSARRSRGWRPAACAARGWRRRRTGAPAPRWPAGPAARPSTWPSSRLSAAPTWPTSVRGSVSSARDPHRQRRPRPGPAAARSTPGRRSPRPGAAAAARGDDDRGTDKRPRAAARPTSTSGDHRQRA